MKLKPYLWIVGAHVVPALGYNGGPHGRFQKGPLKPFNSAHRWVWQYLTMENRGTGTGIHTTTTGVMILNKAPIKGKSSKMIIYLHCLIHPTWVIQWSMYYQKDWKGFEASKSLQNWQLLYIQKLFDPHTSGELNVTMPTFQWKWLIYWALPTSPDLNDLSSLGPWFDLFWCHLPHPFFRCIFRCCLLICFSIGHTSHIGFPGQKKWVWSQNVGLGNI